MTSTKAKSLQTYLLGIQLLAILIPLLLCSLLILFLSSRLVREVISASALSTVRVLSETLVADWAFQNKDECLRELTNLSRLPGFLGARVLDSKKQVYVQTGETGALSDKLARENEVWAREGNDLVLYFPLKQGAEWLGTLQVRLSLEEERKKSQLFLAVSIGIFLVGLLASGLLARLLNRRLNSFLKQLLNNLHEVAESGNYSIRLGNNENEAWKSIPSEFQSLVHHVDSMLTQIESRDFQIIDAYNNLESRVRLRTEELQKAQGALVQSGRMSALGEMSAGIAHEINNPLAIIKGKANQLKRWVESPSTEKSDIAKLPIDIDKMVTRIAGIVRGLRSFARDGEQDPFERTTIKNLISEVLELCSARMKNNGVNIELNIPEAEIVVYCRTTQIGQVLMNLINNAYDAIQSLERRWIKVQVVDIGERVEISIVDSGNGIPQEVQEKLMTPFFTTKGVGKGTGLGLSISKGIVEGHGGNFFLDTKHSNTRFVVVLPKAIPEDKNQAA